MSLATQQVIEGFRLSPQQKRLWLVRGGSPELCVQSAVELDGRLDPGALAAALERMAQLHEILRASFQRLPGMDIPVQVIGDRAAMELREIAPAEIDHLLESERRQPFDFERGPLARFACVALAPERHLLLITLPALCADGRSLENLTQDLARSYAACLDGSEVSDEVVQYIDFSEWQNDLLDSEEGAEERDFWKREAQSWLPEVRLPFEREAGLEDLGEIRTLTLALPRGLTEELESLAESRQATLGATLLTCWGLLLWRVSGGANFSIGRLVDGRNVEPLQGALGLFEKYLPLRFEPEAHFLFTEALTLVQEADGAARARQDFFSWDWFSAQGPAPALAVGFDLRDAAAGEARGRDLRFSIRRRRVQLEPIKLRLSALRTAEGMELELHYAPVLYEQGSMERLLDRFETLLRSVAADPARAVGELEIMPAAERWCLLEERNATVAGYPREACVHTLFEEEARRHPEAPAVSFGGVSLTFRELNERANRLAHSLRRLGVGAESFVGLCLERSVEQIVGLLGILKAGGAYLPLDPFQPGGRLALMLEDSGAEVVLTQEHLRERLPELPRTALLALDGEVPPGADLGSWAAESPSAEVSPENVAYAIYTSGSTGRPKGVMIRHRSVVNLAWALRESVYAGLGDAPLWVSVNAPLTFDASVKQWVQLAFGHALVLVPEEIRPDGEELLRFIVEQRIDALDCTPSQLQLLAAAGLLAREAASLPRRYLVGGEAIEAGQWAELAAVEEQPFFNVYGPTECTVDAAVCRVDGEPARPSIGRAIGNVRLYVMQPDLSLALDGAAGELWVGGDGVARGYLGRPEMTAEKFVPDPFAASFGERLYRTGDLVRYLPDGNLEFLGRVDHQVKIRGFRVELGEVEAALASCSEVKQVVVLLREDALGEKRLVGYVVAREGDSLPEPGEVPVGAELRERLRGRLPDYMVPMAVLVLRELPLTRNGKVDRAALPAPEEVAGESAETLAAPRTPFEEVLAGLWADLLGAERVGTDQSFFDLGGHSLLATQLMSRVREAFRLEMPLRSLFEDPTVEGLARRIEEALRADQGPSAPAIEPAGRTGELALSFAQQRLWFLHQLEPDSPFYNNPLALRLRGPLEVAALAATLGEVVRRHEVLRTRFASVDGRPRQVIEPARAVRLPVVDLSGLAGEPREAQARELAAAEAARPFDLSRGPLLRPLLLRLAPEGEAAEHQVLLTLHHIVSDAWSLGVLAREVSALYAAFERREPSPLPELPVQYADYAAWQRRWLAGDVLAAALAWWKERLSGLPPRLELPADRPRPAVQTHRGSQREIILPAPMSRALHELGRREGATLFMTLLAGFQALLGRYSGQDDLAVGTPIAGRNRLETERLIGFFINTLVLRSRLAEASGFRQLLAQVREETLGAYAHQDLPFEKLVDELQPERSLASSPLFQVMLTLQNAPQGELRLGSLELAPVETERQTTKFDLELMAGEMAGELRLVLQYSTDLFEAVTVDRMLSALEALLSAAVEGPDRRVAELPLLRPEERLRILVEWNPAEGEPEPVECIQERFAAQCERAPGAVALAFEGKELTFAALNGRANRLAHALRKRGVGPEVRVGICLERSAEIVVALLAILKAGGAYVPIDPAWPRERVTFLVEDSGAAVLITQASLAELLPGDRVETLCIDSDWDRLVAPESDENPTGRVWPENLAYVLFTSGSTGRPKGVAVEHRQVLSYLDAVARRLELSGELGFAHVSTFSADLGNTMVFPSLCLGGRLLIASDDQIHDPDRLAAGFRQGDGMDCLKIVPGHLGALLAGAEAAEAVLPRRTLVLGGEALSWDLVERIRALAPGCAIFNHYGPTEATIGVATFRADRAEGRASATVPLGRPLPGSRLYVLGSGFEPMPPGVPGELCIGGANVTRGYLGRPDLTAERFVPDPFESEGGRLYRTGDLVRHLPDGDLEFLGRIDQQVKIRGFRVEPGEIAAVLQEHPAVDQAFVMALQDRLVAWLTAAPGAEPGTEELRAFLRRSLPEPMVPSRLLLLEALPRTRNGKVDRAALPLPDESRPEDAAGFVGPRTTPEEILRAIWSEVLGRDGIGVHDNFFALGGDSILSIQIISRANRAGLRLTPRQIFQHQTIADLAAVAGTTPVVRAEQGIITGPVPLLPIQRRFFELESPEPWHWNMTLLLQVKPGLRPDLLPAALRHLLVHHDALRLRFTRGEEGWRQHNTAPGGEIPFCVVDLGAVTGGVEAACDSVATQAQRSLDLERGPLMRMVWLALGSEPSRLLIAVHHLAVDGVSWRILLEDLETLWRQLDRGEPPRLPAKTTSFRYWAERLAGHARSPEVLAELEHWALEARRRAPRLPRDLRSGANTVASGRTLTVELSEEETNDLLREVPKAYNTQIEDALLAALIRAFSSWTGDEALLIDMEGHGREDIFPDVDLVRTVGWFTIIFPLWLDTARLRDPGSVLKSIKEQRRSVPGRGLGYGLLRYPAADDEISRWLAAFPEAEVRLNYLGQLDHVVSGSSPLEPAPSGSAGRTLSPLARRRYLVDVHGSVVAGRMRLELGYSEAVHHRATLERLAAGLLEELRGLIAHCLSPEASGFTPSDFPDVQLSQDELDGLLAQLE